MAEWFNILKLRIRALLFRRALDRELEEELAFHMATSAAESTDLEARRNFGNPAAIKESCRELWTFRWIEILSADLRYAVRTLRKSPAFTLVAGLTLALGIGANTAIFSVVNAVMLRSLPYPQSGSLVELWGNVKRAKIERRGTSYPDYSDWKKQSASFSAMALYSAANFTLTDGDEPERIPGEFVDSEYFQLLGIGPRAGRAFRAEENEVPQRDAVVVLSDRLWKRRFGGQAGVIGRPIQINGGAYTVLGVMPPEFRGVDDFADLWIPLMMALSPEDLNARGDRGPAVLARLKAGVTMSKAQAEMDAICKSLERAYPATNEARGAEISPLETEIFGDLHKPLVVLLVAVCFVLLIACVNVTNLLLARSEARQREIAVRIALGAGRGRMVHQLAAESLVLALVGATAGLLLAPLGIRMLVTGSPVAFPGYVHPGVDWRVGLFTVAVSCAAGLAMGLAPAAQIRSSNLHETIQQASNRTVDSRKGRRFRDSLVVAEVAFAMLLLVGAGLLIRSVQQLTAIRPGYDAVNVLTMRVTVPRLAPGAAADAAVTARDLIGRLQALAGVESVAAASDAPLTGGGAIFYSAEGQPPVSAQNRPRAYIHRATPAFFQTLRIPFVAGRPFLEQELNGADNVAIVTENLAKRFWPGQDPIGRRIKTAGESGPWVSIIGVVNEMKYRGLPNNPTPDPDIFLPFNQQQRGFAILIRTRAATSSLAADVRTALHESNRGIVIYDTSTLIELLQKETANSRFTSWLMAVFAVIALLLAVIGIYGVMSYTISRRVQEIGLRAALGASPAGILGLLIRDGMMRVILGLLLGTVASFFLSNLIGSLLFGVGSRDIASFAGAALVMATVALLACLLGASRAVRIDPAVALRTD